MDSSPEMIDKACAGCPEGEWVLGHGGYPICLLTESTLHRYLPPEADAAGAIFDPLNASHIFRGPDLASTMVGGTQVSYRHRQEDLWTFAVDPDITEASRRRNAAEYTSRLQDIPGITTPPEAEWAKNVYWMYGILVDKEAYGMNRDQLRQALAEHGIETRTFFIPMHCQPVYWQMFKGQRYPVAERLCRDGFYLPSASSLTLEEIEYIAGVIREVCPNL